MLLYKNGRFSESRPGLISAKGRDSFDHDGRLQKYGDEKPSEFFPSPKIPETPGVVDTNDTKFKKQQKIEALKDLNEHLGYDQRARVLNLYQMSDDHPQAKMFDLKKNVAKAESIFNEAQLYLSRACGYCALYGTVECKIDSDIKKFVVKRPTKEDRQTLINLNEDNPQTSC